MLKNARNGENAGLTRESVAYRNTLGAIEQSCVRSAACCGVANLTSRAQDGKCRRLFLDPKAVGSDLPADGLYSSTAHRQALGIATSADLVFSSHGDLY